MTQPTRSEVTVSVHEQRAPRYGAVLVVESDEGLAQLLTSVMTWSFERVTTSRGVDDALDQVHTHAFDALVVDIGLGHQSGINFLRSARAAGCTAPAVITTGFADELSEASIRGLGVEAVLYKPYPLEALESAVESAVGSSLVTRTSDIA